MNKLKAILAILLGWSAPIIVLVIWVWLMYSKKYLNYSMTKRTMWIVFWAILSPFIIIILGIAIAAVYDSISPITKDNEPKSDINSYTLTSVKLQPTESNLDEVESTKQTETIYVENELEFIEALGSDRIINITKNVELNLSKVLLNETLFSTDARKYINGPCVLDKDTTYVFSETIYDGQELTLYKIRNLTIKATSGAKIVVDSPDATVLEFINCENIVLENLTFGHNTEASCVGQVIGVERSKNITIRGCDLYGCGAYGILAYNSNNLFVEGSIIRDCSNGIMWLTSCKLVTYRDCQFLRNRQFELITIDGSSENILFENCQFENNEGPLFSLETPIMMRSCRILHNIGDLGDFNSEKVIQLDNKTRLQPAPTSKSKINEALRSRAKPINNRKLLEYSDTARIKSLLDAPTLPKLETETFEYIDADSDRVILVKCYVRPNVSNEEWNNIIPSKNYYQYYGYGTSGVHFKRGWSISENMSIPLNFSQEIYAEIKFPFGEEQEFYIEYHTNKGGEQLTEEYLKDALKRLAGINVTKFKIVNYVKDLEVVLQLEESLSDIIATIDDVDKWEPTRIANEGDLNYYNENEYWQIELHTDINVIVIKRNSWHLD